MTVLASAGCALTRTAKQFTLRRVTVSVQIEEDANLRWPVGLQVLILRDEDVLKELQEQSAAQWFAEREAFFRDKPANVQTCADLNAPDVATQAQRCWWEWVPGQTGVGPLALTYRWGAQWALVFADYRTPGDHRWLVDPRKDFTLVLGSDGFTVRQ